MQGNFKVHESWLEHKEIDKLFNPMVILKAEKNGEFTDYTARGGLLTPDDNVLFFSNSKGFNCMGFGARIDKPVGWVKGEERIVTEETAGVDYAGMKWAELRALAKEKGFNPSDYADQKAETLVKFLESLD